jgi:hypothetical protein
MADFSFDELVKKADLGSVRKDAPQIRQEEAVPKILSFPVHYFFTASSKAKEKGTYDFTFDLKTRKYQTLIWLNGKKIEEEGDLSQETVSDFANDIWFILNLPKKQYITNTKSQYLTTDAYERETYGPIMTRSRCELRIGPYFFRWIGEVDTESPFDQLYKALETLIQAVKA